MNRKLVLIIALLLIFLIGMVSAEISVGVKQGDWIEYQVTYVGTPPEKHDVTWAKMEITAVHGKSINLNITAKYSDGTQETITTILNFETGQLGDDFIIPANLKDGDTFYDKNVGNITIDGTEQRTYVGATRTVVYAVTAQTTYYWDKATGILVEASSVYPDYTMYTKADKTNMWQAQTFGLDSTVFYALVIAAVAILVGIALFIVRKKK